MHLTRQKARALPAFIENPEFDPKTGIRLDTTLRLVMTRDREPVESFVPGWRPDAICLLFYPVIVLQFRHTGGDAAYWLLDPSFTYVASSVAALPAATRLRVRDRLAAIAAHLGGIEAGAIPCHMPDDLACFLQLAASNRHDMLAAFDLATTSDARAGSTRLPTDPGRFSLTVATNQDGHCSVGETVTMLMQRGTPAELRPGWRIDTMSSVFFPLLVAGLRHEDGHEAYWFFDRHGNYIIDRWDLLPADACAVLEAHAAIILEDIWQDLVCELNQAARDHVRAFLELPLGIRNAVFDFHHSPPRPQVPETAGWALSDMPPSTMAYVAQTPLGPAFLDRDALERGLLRSIPHQNIALANEGRISWPSPLDGRELAATGCALLLDDLGFAYRVVDVPAGLTFYVVAFGWHFRTFAIYLPDNDLLIARNAEALAESRHYAANYRLRLLRHVVEFGAPLLAGAGKPPGPITHSFRGYPAMHIGHFIWQDLSGLHDFLAAVRPDRIPFFMVPESYLKPEIYGPIDRLFPALQGRVLRTDGMFRSMIPAFYEANARVIKATSMRVPRSVGRAILAGLHEEAGLQTVIASGRALKRQAEITVLVGLRAGNRALLDAAAATAQLLDMIWDAYPTAAVILDGQNASPDASYGSVGDKPASPDSFLRQERAIADALAAHAVSRNRILIDNIGRPIEESLLWCEVADFFVAPWGAGLAKYRWVCGKPGLVVTGRWNLQHRADLSIYHAPNLNEDPEALWFIDPAAVEDDVPADETDPERLGRCNYRLDCALIREQVLDLLESHRRPLEQPA